MSYLWESLVLSCGDTLLGWSLRLPRDLTVVLLGLICGSAVATIRRATTDREQFQRIMADERRLRELRDTARRSGDGEGLARNRMVRRLVAGQRLRQEWKHVGAAGLFLAAAMTWGNARLACLPVPVGEPVPFTARFPATAADATAYVVPRPGVTSPDGWIQPVRQADAFDGSVGIATWMLRFEGSVENVVLTVRCGGHSIEHPLRIGGTTWLPPVHRDSAGIETEVGLAPYRPLGLLPPRMLGLPSWALVLTLLSGAVYASLRRYLSLA